MRGIKVAAIKLAKFVTSLPLIIKLISITTIISIGLTAWDFAIDLLTSKTNTDQIYSAFEVENVEDLVVIKKSEDDSGYYLDFVDGFDDKVEKIVKQSNRENNLHNLPTDEEFLKKIIKAEVITQFPNLGGNIPEGSNGFQGSINIRRVTPNKEIGSIKDNPGRGETTTIEPEEPNYENENSVNEEIVKTWTVGQELEIKGNATVYEQKESTLNPGTDTGYWYEKRKENSLNEYVIIDDGTKVTYTGTYKTSTNMLTKETFVYVEVQTIKEEKVFVRSTNLMEKQEKQEEQEEKEPEKEAKIVTSRAKSEEKKTAGKQGENYTIAIAAGHNNTDDTGARSGSLIEEELTIKTAEKVEELLKPYTNIKVVQTGSTSNNKGGVNVKDRLRLAREANPDLCIQIHYDAGGGSGVQAIYKNGDEVSRQLAEFLSKGMASSMNLPDKGAGPDVERTAVKNLGIIENSVTSGFPSVVTEGGFVDGEPDATLLKGNGTDLCAEGIVEGILNYLKADHRGYIATDGESEKLQESVESKIYNLKYVQPEEMEEYINNGDLQALKVFTLDDSKSLVTATWNKEENGNIKIQKNATVSFRTALQKFVMPFEYLLYFYIDTNETDFSEQLAEEVFKTEIVIAIQDNVTTTKTDNVTKEKQVASISQYSYDEKEVGSETILTEICTPKIEITYADTWCAKYYKENSYSSKALDWKEGEEEKIAEIKGKVSRSNSNTSTAYVQMDKGKVNTEQLDAEGNEIVYTYVKYQKTDTKVEQMIINYDTGEGTTKGNENKFVELYEKNKMHNRVRAPYLYKMLEKNEKTVNFLDLTKYLIYKASSISFGVVEYDFGVFDLSKSEKMSSMGGLDTFKEYLHTWEGNTGVSEDGTKYIVGTDGYGNPTVGYGIDIYNGGYAERIKAAGYSIAIGSQIDIAFIDALEDEAIQSAIKTVESKCTGLDLTIYQKYALVSRIYNCGSSGAFTSRNGKNFVEAYTAYWNQEQDDEYKVPMNDGMFGHNLYTNYMSKPNTAGGVYSRGLERRRKSEWILFKTGYYDNIDKWCSSSEGGDIVQKAIECHKYLRENGFYYAQAGVNIPITGEGRTIDCSSYVSWVLYESGFSEMAGYQQTRYTFDANKWGWQEISVTEAQPGDILIYSGHVEILAQMDTMLRVYNCGGNESIQASGTAELPESSISGYSKTQIKKILRPSK